MPTTPTPRAATSPPQPVIASMDGHGRGSPDGERDLRLVLTMVYRADRPYDVNVVVAQGRPQCGHDPADMVIQVGTPCRTCHINLAPWLVSREVLYSAAMWRTPAGMGDFRAAPMTEDTTQLVFVASDPEYRGEALYVDVQRGSLLEFLDRTVRLVRPGRESEYMDMDRLIASLLDGSTR
jgi:hypothetical protein